MKAHKIVILEMAEVTLGRRTKGKQDGWYNHKCKGTHSDIYKEELENGNRI